MDSQCADGQTFSRRRMIQAGQIAGGLLNLKQLQEPFSGRMAKTLAEI
jgi:hypothetical protein